MTEKDYSPLSTACVRALNDKLYEKRKNGALEIERMVKEYLTVSNVAQIRKLLRVLGQEFTLSQSQNSRKGGLIGLAATAIALGKDSPNYVNDMVKPVLTCFFDSDSRVRYYACESLYNIVKVARGSVLIFFNDIFDGLSKLAADPDQNVRSGSELLDRLMKDIVTESAGFDLVAFMPLLQERITTRNPFARQFVVSWVTTLDAVPDIEMLIFLPEILDGLFLILGDQNPEIRQICEVCLGEFLLNIHKRPGKVDCSAVANLLVIHSQSSDVLIQFTAITWLKEFITQSGCLMLAFASGILTAVIPCLAYDDEARRNIREVSKQVNTALMQLVDSEDGVSSVASLNVVVSADATISSEESSHSPSVQLDVPSLISVLSRQLVHDSLQTRITALRWIYHLFVNMPSKMFCHVEELFPLLLKTLSDHSDEVVLVDLEVLAEISSSRVGLKFPLSQKVDETTRLSAVIQQRLKSFMPGRLNSYFSHFMISLLKLFSTDRQLLDDRGSVIIRQLCLLLNAEDIYGCCSEILMDEDDVGFASRMIQTLSSILLTSSELFELRTLLKELNSEGSCELFCCLYKSWCHNPISTVTLCFLSQNYEHACQLLTVFGSLEVTVEFLTEIDKLVQLIESPIFTYLRLQLLDIDNNRHLVKSLYGLLMLLPQSDAFRTLQHRLHCVPATLHFSPIPTDSSLPLTNDRCTGSLRSKINFVELLEHFCTVQDRHRALRHKTRSSRSLTHRPICSA